MFLGHFALGFAAKRAAPDLSLGTTFAAAQLLDLLWPMFLLTGLERVRVDPGNTAVTPLDFQSYPWSHSLVMSVGWGVLFAGLLAIRRHLTIRLAALVIGLVVSHWVLDWITHRADMPLSPWSDVKVGLGMWRSLPATLALEAALFAGGVIVYVGTTTARNRRGHWALVGLVVLLAAIYLGNLFGPPPPTDSPVPIAAAGLAGWVLVLWAAWIDGNRDLRVRALRVLQRSQ
jgi:membrane-bound metal-dependent hydrolase YbcI (DUF457 family)